MRFLDTIRDIACFARVARDTREELVAMAKCLMDGGIRGIAVCATTPCHLEVISELRQQSPENAFIGASYISSVEQLKAVQKAGAQFAFSPHFDPELMATAIVDGIPLIAGSISPTEMVQAWDSGAAAIHVFPATFVGHDYLAAVHRSLPHIPLIPSHGIAVEDMAQWFAAGATAVCIDEGLTEGKLSDVAKAAAQAKACLERRSSD